MNIKNFINKIFKKIINIQNFEYFYIFIFLLWFFFLVIQFLILSLILNLINIYFFFRYDFLVMVYKDILKIRKKIIKELNRLQKKEITKLTYFKWFLMWVTLIYPKFLWLKFFFCLFRYIFKYIFYIINFFIKDNKYILKYNFVNSCYLMYTFIFYLFNLIFYTVPYKLSWAYIEFRILFLIYEATKFVDSDDFELVSDPFEYFYIFYYKPYQIESDLIPDKYHILKYDGRERNKLKRKLKRKFWNLLCSIFFRLNFTKELRVCKRFININYKLFYKKINTYKKYVLKNYLVYEILYEIYLLLWNVVYFGYYIFLKLLDIFLKICSNFYWGIFYLYIFFKWIVYSIINFFF
jgi:hypothetical protein